jgi:hypothetical protein
MPKEPRHLGAVPRKEEAPNSNLWGFLREGAGNLWWARGTQPTTARLGRGAELDINPHRAEAPDTLRHDLPRKSRAVVTPTAHAASSVSSLRAHPLALQRERPWLLSNTPAPSILWNWS